MFDQQALINRVDSYLRRELNLPTAGRQSLLSITLPVHELRLDALPTIDEDWFFWSRPDTDMSVFGLGSALRITTSGPDRLRKLNQKMQEIHTSWEILDPEMTGLLPLSYLCFAFSATDRMTDTWSGLPNTGLLLPELTLQQRDNRCVASFSVDLTKNQDIELIHQRWMGLFSQLISALHRPHTPPGCKTKLTGIATSSNLEQWRQLVGKAQAAISSGAIQKVVLSRHQRVQAERILDPRQLMTTLDYLYPNSTLIATRIGGRIFVSATPERLVSLHNGEITCDAMAGTIHRSAVAQQDRDLGEQLLSDPKTRHEHQLVVENINASLQPLCSTLDHREQPQLRRLRGLQHLFTEFKGQLKPGVDLLQTADKLHPTAAVNGYPSTEAKQWLQQHEPFERGWYAGAGGWIDCRGNGELAVLLRCALLDGDQADLFAGAGITAGSDADAEYAETELKFSVMLEALENA